MKPVLKSIGSKRFEFYEVILRTDFEGLDARSTVQRRYSEFHTLRKVLLHNGVATRPLSRIRWIPKNMSRWEELNDFGIHLSDLFVDTDVDEVCLKELKRFFQDKSAYLRDEKPSSLSFLDRLRKSLSVFLSKIIQA